MVLGMHRVFLGIFLTASLKHFQFPVAWGQFFWPEEGPLWLFPLSEMPQVWARWKKSKSSRLKAKKIPKKRAEARKLEMLKTEVKRMPQKYSTNPQNHIYQPFYFLSNKFQWLICDSHDANEAAILSWQVSYQQLVPGVTPSLVTPVKAPRLDCRESVAAGTCACTLQSQQRGPRTKTQRRRWSGNRHAGTNGHFFWGCQPQVKCEKLKCVT